MEDIKTFLNEFDIDTHDAFIMIMKNYRNGVVYFKDRYSRITHVNDLFYEKHPQFKGNHQAVIGKTDFDLFGQESEHAKTAYEDEQKIIETGEPINVMESEGVDAKGRIIIAHTRKYPLKNKNGDIIGIYGISEDITDDIEAIQQQEKHNHTLQKLNEELTKENTIDELSGLCNRRFVRATLEYLEERYIQDHVSYCIALVDIDNFKQINDMNGHNEGDRVICFIGETLLDIKNNYYPTIEVCRIGGDEFLIIFPRCDLESTFRIMQEIRQIFIDKQKPLLFNKEIQFSIGLAMIQESDTVTLLIDRADEKLYEVKKNGKNAIGK